MQKRAVLSLEPPCVTSGGKALNKEYLGEGNFGAVYLLKSEMHVSFCKLEVLKVNNIVSATVNEVKVLKRLVEERQRLKRLPISEDKFQSISLLGSGNVVKFLGEEDKGFKMRFVEGAQVSEIYPYAEDYCSILLQMLCALKFVHSAGVSHCDVHEGNIMYDINGKLKLIDFGMATLNEEVDTDRRWLNIRRDIENFKLAFRTRFLRSGGYEEFRGELPYFCEFAYRMFLGSHWSVDEILENISNNLEIKIELHNFAIKQKNRFILDFIENLDGRQIGRTKKGVQHPLFG